MKTTNFLFALMAVAVNAQPIDERTAEVEIFPTLADSGAIDARSIEARAANLQFTVWDNINCEANGGGTTISAADATSKGNFNSAQKSIKLNALNSGYHLSFYTGRGQSPSGSPNLRLNSGNVGNCWNYSPGWLSWGLYSGP
ncbi:hypothetical protein NLU13_9759 [Sarocladium strictum]|uniref:Uncharacterized protein n=1 Tax=Sarocladium strictum TaxID=5046 RepID=A0AA39GBU1_SARSR|nr:hypothetical protein NLU13_9759 [Sarocladium strictum]